MMENLIEEGFCEIRVKGRLESGWAELFDSMKVEAEADATVISGFIADQSALQGVMEKISMFGLKVISIKYGETELIHKTLN